jgi:hypothetical protein
MLLLTEMAFSIGYQHGIFASQSTQGKQWRGTSTIRTEHFSITVMPSYLDVTLDWEFDCDGYEPDSFKNALEIVGNLNLAQDAAVTGMLLWNGEEILKAKLKPLQLAREQYEEVVDRDAPAPQRPRDPVIFEYGWGEDNYDLSIFPVTWQGTRKLRMRYVIPAVNVNGTADIPFPTPFNAQVATYEVTSGPGVTSIALINASGQATPVKTPLAFEPGSALNNSISMIRPILKDASNSSVFYTASINLPELSGSLTHVIGRTGADIVKMAQLKEDLVFLWRWNHAEFMTFYKKQIIQQAILLRSFMEKLTDGNKRAGLVVSVAGGEEKVFHIGTAGSASRKKIATFLDSLCNLEYTDSRDFYNPNYTPNQIDSIITLSVDEFRSSLRLAESLFDSNTKQQIKRIILLTAGPRWITRTTGNVSFQSDSGILVTTLSALAASDELKGTVIPPDAGSFYWPGISAGAITTTAASLSIEAVLTTQSGKTVKIPVTAVSPTYGYMWNFTSPHLDIKVHTADALKPAITWNILMNGASIAEVSEEPAVVTESDPIQFANALAGTGKLESIDGTLPVSLASTLGFVDRQYALLALEDDVMAPLDQQRYRISGVPPLTNADIFKQPDDNVPEEKKIGAPATSIDRTTSIKPPVLNKKPVITFCRSLLTVTFSSIAAATVAHVNIEIYSLSGRLLYSVNNVAIVNGKIHCTIPLSVSASQQALIIRVKTGNISYTKTVALQ